MLTSLQFYNSAFGSPLTINDATYPLKTIDFNLPMKGEYVDKPYRDGRYGRQLWRDGKTMTIEGAILANTSTELNDRRRTLKKYFTAHGVAGTYGGPGNVTTTSLFVASWDGAPEAVSLYCDPIAEPEIPILGLSPAYAEWQAQLYAPDPNWYGSQDTFTSTTPGASSFPVAGDLATLPVVTFTGPMTNPAMTGALNFTFSALTLTAGQTLTIDYYYRSMSHSGGSSPWDGLSYITWDPVAPGTRSYNWTVSTSSTGRQFKVDTYPIFQF